MGIIGRCYRRWHEHRQFHESSKCETFLSGKIQEIRLAEHITDSKVAEIALSLKKIPSRVQKKYGVARNIVELEFALKGKKCDYSFHTNVARKTYEVAHGIIVHDSDEIVLANPHDCYFLVNSPYYFHKHIEMLKSAWKVDARIVHKAGPLCFHDNQRVSDIRESWEKDNVIPYELNSFGVVTHDPEILSKSFLYKDHDGNYYVEICVESPSEDHMVPGNEYHAWLRLVNNAGEVISVGKYPKRRLNIATVALTTSVEFSSADKNEWLNRGTHRTKRIKITENEYQTLKDDIEDDLKHTNSLYFNTFQNNCAAWVLEKLKRADIVDIKQSDMEVLWYNMIFPGGVHTIVEKLKKHRFKVIYTAMHWSALALDYINLPGRCIMFLLGAARLKDVDSDVKPLMGKKIGEFLTGRRVFCVHPWLVYQFAQSAQVESKGILSHG